MSDILSIQVSLNKYSKQSINKQAIAELKESSCIINVSRGEVIDQDALLDGLNTNHIRAAALDVLSPDVPFLLPPEQAKAYSHPLLEHPNVIVTPHIAAMTLDTQIKIGMYFLDKLKTLLQINTERHKA